MHCHAAAGHDQRRVGCIAIGSPSVIVQVDGHIHAVVDGDVLTYIHLQRHRAAVLGRFDGTGQRSVALAVVLRRQICTAGALFAVFIGLIKVVAFRRCRVAALAALRAVGQPVGVGGVGRGVVFFRGRFADALAGVGAVAVICPAGVAVIYRAAVLTTQLARRRVRVAVICVFPVMLKALLKGRAARIVGLLHFSGGRSYSAQDTDVRCRQLTTSGGLPEKVQCAAC